VFAEIIDARWYLRTIQEVGGNLGEWWDYRLAKWPNTVPSLPSLDVPGMIASLPIDNRLGWCYKSYRHVVILCTKHIDDNWAFWVEIHPINNASGASSTNRKLDGGEVIFYDPKLGQLGGRLAHLTATPQKR
jgi:hypothetical protein